MSEATSASVINLKSLGWSLGLLVLSIAIGAAAYFGLTQLTRQATLAQQQAESQKAEAAARLARAKDDENEIRTKIARYKELIARGRTSPERRLEWIETMKGIKESRRLLGLEYEIAPQRRLDEKLPPIGGYDFLVSPMRVEIPLLHENDLFGFIADLGAQVEALVATRHCRLERLPPPTQPNSPLLKALCDIDWITLQEKS